MGGGTTIVEAVSHGRLAMGVDLNPLSRLITGAKTSPLSLTERDRIVEWSYSLSTLIIDCPVETKSRSDSRLKNLPTHIEGWLRQARTSLRVFQTSKERRLARCILLQWGQRVLDSQSSVDAYQAGKHLRSISINCLNGVSEFTQKGKEFGLSKRSMAGNRKLYYGSSESFPFTSKARANGIKLVVTSPPYPGVHVLYHRWQIRGRKETPAPYYIAGRRDGHGESYYTLGGRHKKEMKSYFERIVAAFTNIRPVLTRDALVFQTLGFSSFQSQAPLYLLAMEKAGYKQVKLSNTFSPFSMSREIPHRKWYAKNNGQASGEEYLFCHTPT